MEWIDLTSTILEISGASLPRSQGASLLPLAKGDTNDHRGWVLSEYRNSGHPYDPAVHVTMLRAGDSKIIWHHGPPSSGRERTGELYDLSEDPHELSNLWGDPNHAQLQRDLTALLLDTLVATEDRSQPRKAHW
ncbi:hypothetical protein GCM10027613_23700 [Microlunatus endophyticus]